MTLSATFQIFLILNITEYKSTSVLLFLAKFCSHDFLRLSHPQPGTGEGRNANKTQMLHKFNTDYTKIISGQIPYSQLLQMQSCHV